MDAVRTSDQCIVVLKEVNKSNCPFEEEINRMFTMSDPVATDRHNHIAPVYDVLQSLLDKNIIFLVMPYLMRINKVKFATVGEGIECIRQLFEVRRCAPPMRFAKRLSYPIMTYAYNSQGLQFCHCNNLAHWYEFCVYVPNTDLTRVVQRYPHQQYHDGPCSSFLRTSPSCPSAQELRLQASSYPTHPDVAPDQILLHRFRPLTPLSPARRLATDPCIYRR